MIRLTAIIFVFCLSLIPLQAQELLKGSFSPLIGCRAVEVSFDFSNADVEGQALKDYINFKCLEKGDDYAADFEKDKRKIIAGFIGAFNDANSPLLLTISKDAPIILLAKVLNINRKGNAVVFDYVFIDKNSNSEIATVRMSSQDGMIGSFTNLMGDSFEKAGEDLGKYVKKMLRKETKKKNKK